MVSKYGRKISWDERADLRQEAEIALFSIKPDTPEGLVYRIVSRRVIDYLRKTPPKTEDIDSPDTIRKIDKHAAYEPDLDMMLDARKAVSLVERLPDPHFTIITLLFGLNGPSYTEQEIGEVIFNKSQVWVHRHKVEALALLKGMMEGKSDR